MKSMGALRLYLIILIRGDIFQRETEVCHQSNFIPVRQQQQLKGPLKRTLFSSIPILFHRDRSFFSIINTLSCQVSVSFLSKMSVLLSSNIMNKLGLVYLDLCHVLEGFATPFLRASKIIKKQCEMRILNTLVLYQGNYASCSENMMGQYELSAA